jgi:cytochrome P450
MAADFNWIPADKIVDVDLAGDLLRQNFATILPQWAKSPPFYVMQNGTPQLVCSRYVDVMEVLNDNARFSTVRPAGPEAALYVKFKPDKFHTIETLPQMDGERHARQRRLIGGPFSAPAIARMEQQIDRALDQLIARVEVRDDGFDLMRQFARELMVVALLDIVLKLRPEQKQVFIRMNHALPLTAKTKPGESFPQEYFDAFEQTRVTINVLIAERRAASGEDLVSDLITARDGSDLLSDKELFDLIFTFSAAALESTAGSMGAVVLTLCRHPAVFAQVKENPSLIPAAVEEALRLHGPGFLLVTRYAQQDTNVGGVEVRKGMPIYLSQQAPGYDPARYPQPLRFDLTREQRRITAFGGGIHFCAGQRLARYVLQSGLRKLIEHFPRLRLADDNFQPRYFGAASETQLTSLPVRVD